jgi:hypothetical protein
MKTKGDFGSLSMPGCTKFEFRTLSERRLLRFRAGIHLGGGLDDGHPSNKLGEQHLCAEVSALDS